MNRALCLLIALVTLAAAMPASGQSNTRLRNICRVKGQEENVLRGVGLVVGLNGTGESNDPATMRALARALEIMGNPVSMSGRIDDDALEALKKTKNVALAMVSATVPAAGARSGDQLDCYVSALNGKSLVGGRLAFAALQGPNTRDARVFALCQGAIVVDDPEQPMVGHIHNGCQMEQEVKTQFVSEDGWVTFVLDRNHADFMVANEVAEQIFSYYGQDFGVEARSVESSPREYVQAIDAANVRVRVPELYKGNEVEFIAQLFDIRIFSPEPEARVVVNTRTGSIVISGDVEIGDVVFTHRNLIVETGAKASFLPVAPGESSNPRLDRLVQALANLKVPAEDVIEIIRQIDRMGKLHAKLILM
ncbi:MAG: flagellar basal body P-ring protein FlgI [Lacipirellulaceae bacterium]